MSGIRSYSTSAAENNSPPPNGMPENQPASTVNDTVRQIMADIRSFYEEPYWIDFGDTPTRIDNDTFTVPGNLTARYAAGRRIRLIGATTALATISASSFSSVTTVDVVMDSGNVPSSLVTVGLGYPTDNGAILGYYPITQAEKNASVTPVNYLYPEGHLYRYQTNTTPGTTDMITGWNKMISLVGVIGQLPAETVKLNSNPNIPACAGIRGHDRIKSVVNCGNSVTRFLRLDITCGDFTVLESFAVNGGTAAGAVGIEVGSSILFNGLVARDVDNNNWTGALAIGTYLHQAVGVQFYNCRNVGNTYNWWFEGSDGTPTTCDLYSCWSRTATANGTVVKNGVLIRFYNPLFEANAMEGLLIEPPAGLSAIAIEIHNPWFEGNYGSDTSKYQMRVDSSAAGSTAEVKLFGGYWNGSALTARGVVAIGSGARLEIWAPRVQGISGQIGTASGAQLFVASWGQAGDPDTVIDDSGSACTWYSAGQMKLQSAATSADPLCLDAYDEGANGGGSTFTPTITLGGGSVTYTTQAGRYHKIGSLVIAEIKITVNVATTPSGLVTIGGLPFTSAANARGAVTALCTGLGAGATTSIVGQVNASATTLGLFKYAAGTATNLGADIANGCDINLTVMYRAAA